jgi:hypothetical protein
LRYWMINSRNGNQYRLLDGRDEHAASRTIASDAGVTGLIAFLSNADYEFNDSTQLRRSMTRCTQWPRCRHVPPCGAHLPRSGATTPSEARHGRHIASLRRGGLTTPGHGSEHQNPPVLPSRCLRRHPGSPPGTTRTTRCCNPRPCSDTGGTRVVGSRSPGTWSPCRHRRRPTHRHRWIRSEVPAGVEFLGPTRGRSRSR